ncbi:hypothetical protein ACFSX9_15140 [Flavobacterium ardleyense]|uniref:Uncharacterized protein n=1 Tax=Flavobacterium ardleyense TaxID=2038737 RepID=A0ABW5ZF32_9FLAO
MKRLIVIVALMLFLKPIYPVLEYILQYDYIATELCKNTNKPELECNGKCHLVAELAKTAADEKPMKSDKKNNLKQITQVLFFQDIEALSVRQIYYHNTTSFGYNYANLYFHTADCSVFRPPIFSA